MNHLISFFIIVLLLGCKEKTNYKAEVSFYYWKKNFFISPEEIKTLEKHRVKKLYVKIFDVVPVASRVEPVSIIEIKDSINFNKYSIVPCIFIQNQSLFSLQNQDLDTLSEKILLKVRSICGEKFQELHIDCDWTAETREKYFYLLTKLKSISSKEISATIRLHQIKYIKNTGVPPIDKGVLMCYNVGVIQSLTELNSIFDLKLLKNYTASISSYPVKLDVALPVFSWNVLFRNEKFFAIISEEMNLKSAYFTPVKANVYKCEQSFKTGNKVFLKGDIVRHEEASSEDLKEAVDWFLEKLPEANYIFYHLNKENLQSYEEVFNYCLNR